MPKHFLTLTDLLHHGADTVIDVRSPGEFAEDHIPGAVNMPALSNGERAEVGTIYVQDSPFRARKVGAALVARNVAAHLDGPLADKPGSWQPLVYCWRGGQRSGSFAWMLGEIGWRSETIAGGYQSFRKLVHAALYTAPLPVRLVLLDGYTGTAKTEILARLAARGVQVIDLEGLANHRGSLLGDMPGGQPSQKAFESQIACALTRFDPARPVLLEAESNKVGQRFIPPVLWDAMKRAPRITLSAPPAERARYLATAYADILADADRLKDRLSPLLRLRGAEVLNGWNDLMAAGDNVALTRALIDQHYDPAYGKSRRATGAVEAATITVPTLDDSGQTAAATEIETVLARL